MVLLGVFVCGLLVGCKSDAEDSESSKSGPSVMAEEKEDKDEMSSSDESDGDDAKDDLSVRSDSDGVKVSAQDGENNEVSVSASDKNVSMDLKADGNSIKNNVEISEAEVGMKFYPGSTSVPVASMHAVARDEEVWISTRSTMDSVEQVNAFYATALKWNKTRSQEKNGETKIELELEGRSGEDKGVSIQRSKNGKNTSITLTHKIEKSRK